MRHRIRGRVQVRGLTPQRIAAARRAFRRERVRLALFAEQVADEQPSPEERVYAFDLQQLKTDQQHRDLAAKHWRWGRRQLARLNPATRTQVVQAWNDSWIPADAAYFADFVRRQLKLRSIALVGNGG